MVLLQINGSQKLIVYLIKEWLGDKKNLHQNGEGFYKVGREGFEPSKAKPAELQSSLVDRLSISPTQYFLSPQKDSNHRPADYKSAALTNWAMEAFYKELLLFSKRVQM